jgi:hypothetical protein
MSGAEEQTDPAVLTERLKEQRRKDQIDALRKLMMAVSEGRASFILVSVEEVPSDKEQEEYGHLAYVRSDMDMFKLQAMLSMVHRNTATALEGRMGFGK